MEQPPHTPAFRVSMVPGIMPGRWARTWRERHPGTDLELVPVEDAAQLTVVRAGSVEMAFVRDVPEHDGLHLIPLYAERSVVVLPREHPWSDADELVLDDLADEHLLQDPDTVPGWAETAAEMRTGGRLVLPEMTTRQAVEVVASGTGVVVLPMSVARLHHRKDVVAVPVADLPEHPVGLAWPRGAEETDPRIEDFIGVVRGRTARSSRGRAEPAPEPETGQASRGRAARPARQSARRPGKGRTRGRRRS